MGLNLQIEIEHLFREKMMEFLAWSEAEWKITEKETRKDDWAADMSPDYIQGYNAAIGGMKTAYECWNEEFGPC